MRLMRPAGWWAVGLVASLSGAWAQAQAPHLGYAYPAGGQQGTTVRVTLGGQFLRHAEAVCISGEGVRAAVVEYVRPLDDEELGRTYWFLRDLVKRRWSLRAIRAAASPSDDKPPLPDHPWLRDLDEQSPAQIARLRARLFDPRKQPNAQIAEQVDIDVVIDPAAPPGDRELRLLTAAGLSNPVRFQVGALPEVREEDVGASGEAPGRPVEVPVLLNGQIMPGEVDRFKVRAHAGQRLVIRVQARWLMPYLADAVPGWFQATVTLRDDHGNQLAYADDYRFDPDPVLLYQVPRDGVYELEVRDAIYRGREDFVYRISVGELPFITSIFPLGGQVGVPTVVTIGGWNLPTDRLTLDTRPGEDAIRRAGLGPGVGNEVTYAVDDLPEATEAEPNDTPAQATRVTVPCVLNGRFDRPGDQDLFTFEGRADDELVAEVYARRLGSPADPALRLYDPAGALLTANDDHDDPAVGLVTHQADPYLRARLPQDGTYRVQVLDPQRQGGEAHGYRLHLRRPRPDFALRVTPSSLSMPVRRPAAFTVHALRRDGFDGPITVVLRDAPAGFTLTGGPIAGDQTTIQMTLTPPRNAPWGLFRLHVEGRADIGGARVTHPATPAEDMMQAFIYRHLVPQQELLAAVTGSRPVPAVWRPLLPGVQIISATPVRIPRGGTAQVRASAPPMLPGRQPTPLESLRFALCQPPRGVRLQAVTIVPDGLILTLKADANSTRVGDAGNLIVEAWAEQPDRPVAGPRVALGVLPAIPFRVDR